ncbi:MAG: thiamine pyrophosphate-dependent enzyme [Patescibacteria group bacterium]
MKKSKNNYLLSEGHTACSGCGELLAARHVAEAAGKNTIILNSTGCLEVTTSQFPNSSWRLPWMHSLFENSSAIATGVSAALKYKKQENINVIAQSGDGGAFDIGFGLISGMWERNDNILYVCYDNEAYMNTGVQASGATSLGASTTTTPAGHLLIKKNLPEIAMAHRLPYVAVTTCGHISDIEKKVKKALSIKGAKYIQILCGCTPGWNYETNLTVKLGKLAQQSGLYPVFEAENGEVVNTMKVPKKKVPVSKFLEPQKRFRHLFKNTKGRKIVNELQEYANQNIIKYKLN